MNTSVTTTAPARPTFAGLDTLRAIAAIAVVATHTCFWSGFYGQHGTLGVATHRLEVGVPIFFVLSGFLLSYPYLNQIKVPERPHDRLPRYTVKRIARIVPVYLVTVVLALTVLDQNTDLGPDRWFANLLGYDYYAAEHLPQGLAQMWSLYVEVAFYALLPALMWLMSRVVGHRWRPGRLLALVGAVSAVSVVWILADGSQKALPGYLLWFGVGIAMSVAHLHLRDVDSSVVGPVVRRLRTLAAMPGVCWMSAGALFALSSTPLTGPASLAPRTTGELLMRLVLYALIAGLIVGPSVFGTQDSRYARGLARPWARHLGHISYSLFCIHVVVLELVAPWLGFALFASNPAALFAVVLSISLVAAELLYRLVERPAVELAHRGRRHHGTSQAPSTTNAAA